MNRLLRQLNVNRRRFLAFTALALSGVLGSLFKSKAFATVDFRKNGNIPKNYIQNRDTPGFFIRSANPFMGVDINRWSLKIGGMVKNPTTLLYEDLFQFRTVSQESRLKCVECWSAKARWEGFPLRELIEKVQPDPAARYVYLQSADSYYESFTLKELLAPRALMVLRMDGKPLSPEHGFPLRLIVPFKYGYKNIKYITRIDFIDSRKQNYWARFGPYSVDGTIQPGIDHPLDFNKKPLPINGGEVFHFFDKRPT